MTLDELIDDVALEVPDAPRATIGDMLRWAARRLCTEADVWVERDIPVVVAANTDYAQLASPGDGEALRVVSLTVGSRDLKSGRDYEQISPTEVRFTRTPDDDVIHGAVACRPLPGRMMPSELLSYWHEALAHGARYRLFLLPHAWRDADLAQLHQRHFNAHIAQARQRAALGYARGGRRVRMRRFV